MVISVRIQSVSTVKYVYQIGAAKYTDVFAFLILL